MPVRADDEMPVGIRNFPSKRIRGPHSVLCSAVRGAGASAANAAKGVMNEKLTTINIIVAGVRILEASGKPIIIMCRRVSLFKSVGCPTNYLLEDGSELEK